ncbi:hypothetical protein Ancab_027486 [Ancistrocladus abbreviatus]
MERGDSDGHKRKIEDEIELAKQRAQEIAARLINTAESKRPRLDTSLFSSISSATTATAYPPPPPPPITQFPVSVQTGHYNGFQGTSKKILIPNAKVGVIIGRGGDMIKNLQLRSGARIQITRDADADPNSLTRDVELMGTSEQISRAEELINEVIAETDAANSASSGNRSISTMQAGAELFVMKVPNDRVALVIGKGGETIKNMQSKSGARIQVVPLHLPPGDTSTERSVHISGTKEQIDSAKDLINEVVSGNRLNTSSGSAGYVQPVYSASAGWASTGQPPVQQQAPYGYGQEGTYSMPPPYYGSYPPQQAGWEQTNPSAVPPAPLQNTSYNMYSQQAQPVSTPNISYNYSQMPPAAGYSYNQGYPQQPTSYGQDYSGQAPLLDQQKPYSNPAYGTSATSSQPDGTTTPQASQPGYGPPAVLSQADGNAQSQSSAAYTTGYSQPTTTTVNGYGTYPGYAAQPSGQIGYNQSSYAQTAYDQLPGVQVSTQACQSYYGQSGYSLPQAPAQANYYQGTYPPVAGQPNMHQPQSQPLSTNGVSQPSGYSIEKADDGNPANGSGGVAQETDNPKS